MLKIQKKRNLEQNLNYLIKNKLLLNFCYKNYCFIFPRFYTHVNNFCIKKKNMIKKKKQSSLISNMSCQGKIYFLRYIKI